MDKEKNLKIKRAILFISSSIIFLFIIFSVISLGNYFFGSVKNHDNSDTLYIQSDIKNEIKQSDVKNEIKKSSDTGGHLKNKKKLSKLIKENKQRTIEKIRKLDANIIICTNALSRADNSLTEHYLSEGIKYYNSAIKCNIMMVECYDKYNSKLNSLNELNTYDLLNLTKEMQQEIINLMTKEYLSLGKANEYIEKVQI